MTKKRIDLSIETRATYDKGGFYRGVEACVMLPGKTGRSGEICAGGTDNEEYAIAELFEKLARRWHVYGADKVWHQLGRDPALNARRRR